LVSGLSLRPWPVVAFLAGSLGAISLCFLALDRSDALFGGILATLVLIVAAVDVDRFEIPDLANALILIAGLAWQALSFDFAALMIVLLRCFLTGALLFSVRAFYRHLRNIDGLGLGDVKLAAAGAAWLDWEQMGFALAVAIGGAVFVIVARRIALREPILRDTALPFGAFLAPAIWVAWIAQMTSG
jgi:leader peptidase (prepilin peptidase) / N-methyltransferase